jgi:hypothetical protein
MPVISDEMLRDLYVMQQLSQSEIAERFGVTRNVVHGRVRRLGLPAQPKRPLSMTPDAIRLRNGSHDKDARRAAHSPNRSLITFLPESPRLEMQWRHVLAKVRAERGARWTELLGVER